MPSLFVHAQRRQGGWVHVLDLDPRSDRGRACDCVCAQCGRPLVAHFGELKAAHFQHLVEEVSCNPQPMTLLHAFARDHIASKRELWLPGLKETFRDDRWGQTWTEEFSFPEGLVEVSSSTTETPVFDIVPDVLLELAGPSSRLAVEVKFTHAVDQVKQEKIHRLRLNCIEFDISDLPSETVSASVLDTCLKDPRRWTWIWSAQREEAAYRFKHRVGWEGGIWEVDRKRIGPADLNMPPATARLRVAQARLPWAKETYEAYRAKTPEGAPRPSQMETAAWLASFETEDRMAIFCAAMGLEPINLPVNFQQKVQQGFDRHPYAWQLGIFVAFGFRRELFSSEDVAVWLKAAMPECVRPEPGGRRRNGFTLNSASAHFFLLLLEHQGLILSNGHIKLEQRKFRARFKSISQFHRHLPAIIGATGVVAVDRATR